MKGILRAGNAIGHASTATVILSFFVNLILSASMNMLWSMMNSLQIIVHLPLMNLSYPSNA